MGRNSKDNSLKLYEDLIKISVRYNDYLERPRRIGFASVIRRKRNDAISYVYNVRRTISELNNEDRNIIKKEFFVSKRDPQWWMKYYSRSTYYRKRYFAIKSFMEKYVQ